MKQSKHRCEVCELESASARLQTSTTTSTPKQSSKTSTEQIHRATKIFVPETLAYDELDDQYEVCLLCIGLYCYHLYNQHIYNHLYNHQQNKMLLFILIFTFHQVFGGDEQATTVIPETCLPDWPESDDAGTQQKGQKNAESTDDRTVHMENTVKPKRKQLSMSRKLAFNKQKWPEGIMAYQIVIILFTKVAVKYRIF